MRRPRELRRLHLSVLAAAVLLLAPACAGERASDRASDRASQPASETAEAPASTVTDPAEPVDPVVPVIETLIELPAAGGDVTRTPTRVDTAARRTAYLASYDQRARATLRSEIAAIAVPDGAVLTATVVALGCESPTAEGVTVIPAGDGYVVEATAVKDTGVRCLVPVTTVALVLLPRR